MGIFLVSARVPATVRSPCGGVDRAAPVARQPASPDRHLRPSQAGFRLHWRGKNARA